MSVILSILAAGSLPALIFGAPVPSLLSRDVAVADVQSLQTRSSSSYTVFGGDGTTTAGWPSINDWVATYDEMFAANKATMSASCTNFGFENDSDDEINSINSAIQSVSASSGVDARFILAIVMQESTGCVRVGGTNNGVNNPGLMQSHNGKGTCNTGTPLSPCPSSEITQMIEDGTTGTADGDGLKQLIAQAIATYGADGATEYYRAARMYNSGSLASDLNLGQGGATACYASDIANRLLGWSTGTSSCVSSVVQDLTSSGTFVSGNDGSASSGTTTAPVASATSTAPAISSITVSLDPTTTAAPTATPTDTKPVAAPTTTTTTTTTPPAATSAAASASATSSATSSATTTLTGPVYPGAVSTCQQWTLVVSGEYCLEVESDIGITASQFEDWNSGLDAVCSNLWLGYEYCVKA
ncbi:uncharacterized protein BHQ10_010110 [Talaromyces amestolkiae]|uniref:LysM domain-containing protein n=1 Tax=Talaromyces amestolkiae TaxID=1196081 RepID=A0A364LE57_TALAM|nr:uncharacterized protein BHQ10_010110 [Talaromyces amestolkiae]RAO74098.1 hypothetical protein BHQ10_010110 [Talaromyces amestolkiae]